MKNRNSPMNKFAMGSSAHHRPPNIRYSFSRRFQYSFVGFQGATSLRTACRRISGRRFSGREATTGNTSAVHRLGCNLMSAQLNLVVTHIQRKKVTQAFNFFMIRKKKEEKKKKNAVTTKIKSTNIS